MRHRHAAAPAFFTWYVLGRPLDLATHPGGLLLSQVIILNPVKQYCIRLSQERRDVASVSRLVLGAARLGDGGLYTCSPGNTISGVTILYPALQLAPASATPPSRSASSQVGGICCSTLQKLKLKSFLFDICFLKTPLYRSSNHLTVCKIFIPVQNQGRFEQQLPFCQHY